MRSIPLVLLVDDEDMFLDIASAKLKTANFETAMAHGTLDALKKAESLQPDLILSDIYMPPGPSGWDLALALHENPKTRGIKVAFFTSLHDPWGEMDPAKRTLATRNLRGVPIFSKTEIEKLVSGIQSLITR